MAKPGVRAPTVAALAIAFCAALVGCGFLGRSGDTPLPSTDPAAARTFVFVGTAEGELATLQLEANGDLNPRTRVSLRGPIVAITGQPRGRSLVAVDGTAAIAVHFAIDPNSGELRLLGSMATGGMVPARAVIDRSGKYAFVTHVRSADVAVMAVNPDRALGIPEIVPADVGASGIGLHPSNAVVFVASPRAGTVVQYQFDADTGKLSLAPDAKISLPAGSGPRQVACHPNGRWVYVLNENNNTIALYPFDLQKKTLTQSAYDVLPTVSSGFDWTPTRAADFQIDGLGRFLFVVNRGHDSVAAFRIDATGGTLTSLGFEMTGGQGATALSLDPTGAFVVVANQKSRNLTVFRVDQQTGRISLVGTTPLLLSPLALVVMRPVH